RDRGVRAGAGRLALVAFFRRTRFEARVLLEEGQRHVADGTVTLLGDDQRRAALALLALFVVVRVVLLTHKQADEIGVLLDGSGLTKIAQTRAALRVATALFRITIELREHDDRDLQLL